MSGYSGFAKSNNAIEAEEEGRFPAGEAAKKLGVPSAFLRDCAQTTEWHHSSKFFNRVKYYDIEELREWLADEEEDGGKSALSAWKAKEKIRRLAEKIHENCTVIWLEWGGSRNRPRATERKVVGAIVTDKGGKMVEVTLPSGGVMKKGKHTNGFKVFTVDGQRIRF